MFADEVNSQKARIKLIIALNAGLKDLSELRPFLEN